MIDACWVQKYVDCRIDAALNTPLKGVPQTFYYGGAGTYLSNGIHMPDFNSVNILIIPPSGSGVTADLHVQGSVVNGGYLDLSDPNAVTTGITTRQSIDVIVGTEWVAIQLENVAGTYDAGQQWQVTVTPYISPGQTRVQATISVQSLSAITAITGSLEVTGACTIDVGGSLSALGTDSAKLQLDATGLKTFNTLGTQTAQILNDGSGWLGTPSTLAWDASGVVSIDGGVVQSGTLPTSATNFPSVPLIDGLTFTNNSPSAGFVSWSACTLTIAGGTYSIPAGNTSDKYIYWQGSNPSVFQTSATPPANNTFQFLIGINSGGSIFQSIFGSVIYADYISVTTLAAIQANIGACTISDVLTIGTSGGIYQGTGTFAAPTTGLKISNSSGIGTLATYSAGTRQVQLDTTGSLVAGAGIATLNANGLNLGHNSTLTQNGSIFWGQASAGNQYSSIAVNTSGAMLIQSGAFGASIWSGTHLYLNQGGNMLESSYVPSGGLGGGTFTIDTNGNVTPSGAFKPNLSNGSAAFGLDSNLTGTTVANGATFTPFGGADAALQALVIVTLAGDNQSALFLVCGQVTPVLIAQTASVFSTTAGTASSVNVYVTSNTLTIQNNRSSQEIRVAAWALRH